MKRALDVGGGHNPVRDSGWWTPGDFGGLTFTNMDGFHVGADVKHKFEEVPWPFPDDTFDFVFARHTLEHVRRDKLLDVMAEICRVAKDGANILVRVPYWNSEAFAGDPTHWNPFCETTFRHMCYGGSLGTEYYAPTLFRMRSVEFKFQPKFRFIPRRLLKELMHVLCGVCDEMWIWLQVQKTPAPEGAVPYQPRYSYGWVRPTPKMAMVYGIGFWWAAALVAFTVARLLFA